MKNFILGMAKSPLQVKRGAYNGIADENAKPIKAGSSRSLELDFLRLVYATKELRLKGYNVNSYLMVTTLEVIKLVERWSKKYDVEKDVVTILHADLMEDELNPNYALENNIKFA